MLTTSDLGEFSTLQELSERGKQLREQGYRAEEVNKIVTKARRELRSKSKSYKVLDKQVNTFGNSMTLSIARIASVNKTSNYIRLYSDGTVEL